MKLSTAQRVERACQVSCRPRLRAVEALVEQDAGPDAPTRPSSLAQSSLPNLQLPPTVQTVLGARLDRLIPEAKRLLQTAAVMDREVPVPLLRAGAEEPAVALQQGLAHLQAGRVSL